tara:strand:+ start:148 stop:516 length:369 start_codon:yes stop_codon:yes gene_type:complete
MSDNLPVQFDQNAIMESMLNPLGSLNLSPTETKLLFFRHLGAEYAQSAKRGRVPYASQLVKAGTAFGGLAGGADPMMMMMMANMFNQQQPKQEVKVETDIESVLVAVLDRLDAIEAKVGAGA